MIISYTKRVWLCVYRPSTGAPDPSWCEPGQRAWQHSSTLCSVLELHWDLWGSLELIICISIHNLNSFDHLLWFIFRCWWRTVLSLPSPTSTGTRPSPRPGHAYERNWRHWLASMARVLSLYLTKVSLWHACMLRNRGYRYQNLFQETRGRGCSNHPPSPGIHFPPFIILFFLLQKCGQPREVTVSLQSSSWFHVTISCCILLLPPFSFPTRLRVQATSAWSGEKSGHHCHQDGPRLSWRGN